MASGGEWWRVVASGGEWWRVVASGGACDAVLEVLVPPTLLC